MLWLECHRATNLHLLDLSWLLMIGNYQSRGSKGIWINQQLIFTIGKLLNRKFKIVSINLERPVCIEAPFTNLISMSLQERIRSVTSTSSTREWLRMASPITLTTTLINNSFTTSMTLRSLLMLLTTKEPF